MSHALVATETRITEHKYMCTFFQEEHIIIKDSVDVEQECLPLFVAVGI